ncbi:hypothetical protein L1987_29835 [Smallanthus sonchifolius]|uniref:Uncharacterized protein n=1 Tax=Smallanthus sonchifolius TaxID=185202 RepID=A0ACB9I1Q9_9ASTR|nr:hypothetical protein L1987_29835 [Smallanthus sonchifolius]
MACQALLFRGSDEVLQSGFKSSWFLGLQFFILIHDSRGLQVNRSRDFNTIFKRAITALKEEAMVFKNHQMLSQGRKGW